MAEPLTDERGEEAAVPGELQKMPHAQRFEPQARLEPAQ